MFHLIDKLRNICVVSSSLIIVGSTVFNYFVSYKMYDDIDMEWLVYKVSISFSMFLMGLYLWLSEHRRRSNSGIIISGWLLTYLSIVLAGVVMGYNLPSAELVIPLLITTLLASFHIAIKLWRNFF